MRITTILMLATIALGLQAAQAQQPAPPKGGAVVTSSPGKYAAAAVIEVTATVTGIDKVTRTVTLKGPDGKIVDLVASDEVRNFDQIRLGDSLVVQYREALTLELKKARATPGATETVAAARAEPGQRPGGALGREVVVLADVVGVDPVKSIISLKGPNGKVVELKVQNPDHFKVVKVGDQVEAVHTAAVAISVKPAAKPAAK